MQSPLSFALFPLNIRVQGNGVPGAGRTRLRLRPARRAALVTLPPVILRMRTSSRARRRGAPPSSGVSAVSGRIERLAHQRLRDHFGARQRHRLLQHIEQLPHVARPRRRHQQLHRLGREPQPLAPIALGQAPQEMVGQQRYVLAPLRQRRNGELHHVSADSRDLRETPPTAMRSSNLRCVAEITRTSMSWDSCEPTGRTVRSSSARNSFTCSEGGMSPTSSRNSVPSCAA